MHSKLKAEYNCSQEELYSALGTAWGNCAAHLPAFTAHKGFYSTGYIVAARNLLTTAKVLPDDMARAEEARVLRVSLTTLGETSRKNFQKLKSYIVSAYADAEIQKIKFDAAGQKYYARAGREDWESIAMLNQAGDNFITTHLTDLNANNNMPATFPSAFQTDKAAFDLVHDQYKLAEETGEETAAKINANNAIYKLTTDMLADGQLVAAGQHATHCARPATVGSPICAWRGCA